MTATCQILSGNLCPRMRGTRSLLLATLHARPRNLAVAAAVAVVGMGRLEKGNPKQAKWMKKEVKRLVANAMTVREKVDDDEDEGEVAMKTDDGNGHKMRQSN